MHEALDISISSKRWCGRPRLRVPACGRFLPRAFELGIGVVAAVMLLLAGFGGSPVAVAQVFDDGLQSYIAPLANGQKHRLLVLGDSLAEGTQAALLDAMNGDPRLEIERKHRWLSGLSRPEHADELRDLEPSLRRNGPNILVVLLGTQDRWSLRVADGRRLAVGSMEWRDAYGRLVDETMRAMKRDGVSVYWVGLPIMRREEVNAAAIAANDVMRERAYLNGIKYIDIFSGFADEEGNYSAYGPDLAGKTRQLRDRDGIDMTEAGYGKLAHFIETELRRDLAAARAEKAIALAGDEAEQSRVRPASAQISGVSQSGSTPAAASPGALDRSASSLGGENAGPADQKAETSRISVKTLGRDGREEAVTVEIVRPAIPAAVLALVTRRESPDKATAMGDVVVDQIPGGLTVMSSITPAGDLGQGGKRKLSPAQTPYFRVLVKGERLTPRVGRADDASWPKPEPPPAAPQKQAGASQSDEDLAAPSVPLPREKDRSRRRVQR